MVKGVIGLLILAVCIIIRLIKGALSTGRDVYEAFAGKKVNTGDPYLDKFIEATSKLGVDVKPNVEIDQWVRAGRTPYEFALLMAVNHHANDWIANPAMGPRNLTWALDRARLWVRAGTIRPECLEAATLGAEGLLLPHGLSIE